MKALKENSLQFLKKILKRTLVLSLGVSSLISIGAVAEFSGSIGGEARYFTETEDASSSILINPEYYWQSESGNHLFYGEVFARADDLDSARTYADIREALYTYAQNSWELSAGVGKVFWGVTESNHLVDVINQTDLAESADGEAKLGQPMVKWSTSQSWGILDAYVLPYFRERRFPSVDSPLSGGIEPAEDVIYEHEDEEKHIDYALRYSQYLGDWDIGLYYFNGTNRNAMILPQVVNGVPSIYQYYNQIEQYGTSVQATLGAWLWKFEAIYQENSLEDYFASSAGFEYTAFGIANSTIDLGLLLEHNYDDREEFLNSTLQNDIFLGSRLTFNDVQDTNFLLGFSQDLDESSSRLAFIEANRRLGESYRLTIDARIFDSDEPSDFIYTIKKADYVSLTLEYFY